MMADFGSRSGGDHDPLPGSRTQRANPRLPFQGEAKRVCRNAESKYPRHGSASVRLAAQEGRDLQVILVDRIVHRRRPSVRVEPLRRRPGRGGALGIFGNRVVRFPLPARRRGRSTVYGLRLRTRRRVGLLGHGLFLFAPAQAHRGKALQ